MISVSAPVFPSSRSHVSSIPRSLCLPVISLPPSYRPRLALVCFLTAYPATSAAPGCHQACSLDAGWSHWASVVCFRGERCSNHSRQRSTRTILGRIWVSESLAENVAAGDVSVSALQRQQESMSAVTVVLSVMGCGLLVKRARRACPTT